MNTNRRQPLRSAKDSKMLALEYQFEIITFGIESAVTEGKTEASFNFYLSYDVRKRLESLGYNISTLDSTTVVDWCV